MAVSLGIDTGGTYTDAVLYDRAEGVLASGKALTTKHELSIGVAEAIGRVMAATDRRVDLVSLSTTLATNAIVEGQGGRICLILIGLEAAALERAGLRQALDGDPVVFLAGGHDGAGDELSPLDREAAEAAIAQWADSVEAFAVAGQFATRNPSHERTVADLASRISGLPVTCSHELSAKLDAPRRALTTLLNARLVPLIDRLIRAVLATLEEEGIEAPLMVVRGDGTLVAAAAALERPIETLLSGPAASLAGAQTLSGVPDALVSDIGGTTTDIAVLVDGLPALAPEGAYVGGWRTMVEAVEVHTSGLGGDSWLRCDRRGGLLLGPRRAVPLSLLARQHPEILPLLRERNAKPLRGDDPFPGCFAVKAGTGATEAGLRKAEAALLAEAADGPLPLDGRIGNYLEVRALERLLDRGLLVLAGFTPSDAAHVLGLQETWQREAAELGAVHLARLRARATNRPLEPTADLGRQVLELLTVESARRLVAAATADSAAGVWDGNGKLTDLVLGRALRPSRGDRPLLDIDFRLTRPLVALGAPARLVYPGVAERLNAELLMPEHAGVANAVGAAAGDVAQAVTVLVTSPAEGRFRAHLSNGPRDFPDLEPAAEAARREAERIAGRSSAQQRRRGIRGNERASGPRGQPRRRPGALHRILDHGARARPANARLGPVSGSS